MTGASRRPGRRPGKQDTRGRILQAARAVFADRGFEAASIRQIAATAGVDPALVHHYFGSKDRLFRSVIALPFDPEEILTAVFAAGPEQVPERLVRTFLRVWSGPVTGPAMAGLVRSAASHATTARLVREFFRAHVVRHLVRELGGHVDPDEIPTRASLVASQLLGLAVARYLLRIEPIAGLADEAVVAAVAPTIRRYLLDPLDLSPPGADDSCVTTPSGVHHEGKGRV